jgi:hypothetical protein
VISIILIFSQARPIKSDYATKNTSEKNICSCKRSLPGGEDMVQVDVFNERLDSESSLDFLIAHDLGNLEGSFGDSGNEGVAELSFLENFRNDHKIKLCFLLREP